MTEHDVLWGQFMNARYRESIIQSNRNEQNYSNKRFDKCLIAQPYLRFLLPPLLSCVIELCTIKNTGIIHLEIHSSNMTHLHSSEMVATSKTWAD